MNEKLLDELIDKESLVYKNAQEAEDIFKVWKLTYAQDAATKGIFESEIQLYHIGKLKFNLGDLNTVSSKDIQGKYHEFATILRQHNVSGRENAFDKLVNLFLCKVVDENEHSNDLQFYWKGIVYDNYFDLIDRLQRLYKIGMDKFLEKEVTYVDEKSIDNACTTWSIMSLPTYSRATGMAERVIRKLKLKAVFCGRPTIPGGKAPVGSSARQDQICLRGRFSREFLLGHVYRKGIRIS